MYSLNRFKNSKTNNKLAVFWLLYNFIYTFIHISLYFIYIYDYLYIRERKFKYVFASKTKAQKNSKTNVIKEERCYKRIRIST